MQNQQFIIEKTVASIQHPGEREHARQMLLSLTEILDRKFNATMLLAASPKEQEKGDVLKNKSCGDGPFCPESPSSTASSIVSLLEHTPAAKDDIPCFPIHQDPPGFLSSSRHDDADLLLPAAGQNFERSLPRRRRSNSHPTLELKTRPSHNNQERTEMFQQNPRKEKRTKKASSSLDSNNLCFIEDEFGLLFRSSTSISGCNQGVLANHQHGKKTHRHKKCESSFEPPIKTLYIPSTMTSDIMSDMMVIDKEAQYASSDAFQDFRVIG